MLYLARVVATCVVAAAGICEDSSCKEAPVDLLQSRVNVHVQSSKVRNDQAYTYTVLAEKTSCAPMNKAGTGGFWLQIYNEDPSVCMNAVLERADCSHKYFNLAANDADFNCGCINPNITDCSENGGYWHNVGTAVANIYEIVEVFDESGCMATCMGLGHCCNDPSISSNQYLSCAQACKIRASGVSIADCKGACDEPRSCERTVGDTTYKMCKTCTDITDQCPHGVQGPSACQAGCDHEAFTTVVLWNFHSKRVLQAQASGELSVPVHNFSSLDEIRNLADTMKWIKADAADGSTIRDKTSGKVFFAGPPAGEPCNHNCEFGNNFGIDDAGNNADFENWEFTEYGTETLFGQATPRFTIKNTNSGRKIFAQNSGGVGANSGKIFDDQTWYVIDVGP